MKLHIDIETRSTVDLRKSGLYPYAAHPSTDVLLARFCVDDGEIGEWRREDIDAPVAVVEALRAGATVVAHNFHFERILWKHVLAPRYGWPEPPLEAWDCTMSRARAAGLPGSLDGAARALQAPFAKDQEGASLMLRMCKPRAPRKDEDPDGIFWFEDEPRLARLSEYCAQDVRVERWLDARLPPLSPAEREVWLADARLNDRGVPIDVSFCRAANLVAGDARKALDEEMRQLTGGAVRTATNVRALAQWLIDRGVDLTDPDAPEDDDEEDGDDELPKLRRRDVERLLRVVPEGVERQALQVRLEAGKASVKKVDAMLARAGDDDRVRGMQTYYGAGTGRWSAAGSGIQLQNLPRAGVKNWDLARSVLDCGAEAVETIYGPPLDLISRMLRGAICAKPGRKLIHADLASVEARGVAWLAGQDDLVERFDQGADVYCDMAGEIFGRSVTKADEFERWLGKSTVLGAGYGMGWRKFVSTCAAQGRQVPDALAERAIRSYRETYERIPLLWRAMEDRAIAALQRPGRTVYLDCTQRIAFHLWKGWLLMRLPSGRRIMYRDPALTLDEKGRPQISYWGVSSLTKKWSKQTTYGARLVENAVQGLCRDIIAEALLRLDRAGYGPILTVHDEIICEVDEAFGSADEMIAILTQRPDWAADFPIAAEGKAGRRYSKGG